MNSAFLFAPFVLCLVVAFCGIVCTLAATVGLRKKARDNGPQRGGHAQPPLLGEGAPKPGTTSSARTSFLKILLALGLGMLAAGVLGAWATGPSIGLAHAPVAEWSDGRAPELEPLIRKHCAPFISEGNTVGLAVAAVTPTNATIMTFGHPALSSSAPTGPDTLFELGSITKTFTALVLACEIERGKLKLDEPVQQLLPRGVALPKAARGITLRNLTTHTSGFPRLPAGWSPFRAFGMLLFGSDPYASYTEADLLRDVQRVKLQSKPGTKASYSNYGMMLLGYLLAREAGCSYEELVKREVCLPLGMTNTTVTLRPAQRPLTAQAYRAVLRCGPLVLALRSAPWLEGNPLGGAGGLRSTASDMLKYLRANMHPEGQPLAEALRQSHRPLFKDDEHDSYAMNWIISDQPDQKVIWHNGGTGGFRSYLGFTADGRKGVLVLSNSSEDVDGLAGDLLSELQ